MTANPAGLAPGTYNADGDGRRRRSRRLSRAASRSRSRVAAAPPPPPPPPTVLLGTATLQPNRDGVGAGTASAFRTVATATGSMAKLNVYLDSANRATRLVAGVYANSRRPRPGRLLTQATLTSVTSGAWNALTVPKASVAAGTTYWIAVLSPSGRGTLQIRDRFGGGRSETSSQRTLSSAAADVDDRADVARRPAVGDRRAVAARP